MVALTGGGVVVSGVGNLRITGIRLNMVRPPGILIRDSGVVRVIMSEGVVSVVPVTGRVCCCRIDRVGPVWRVITLDIDLVGRLGNVGFVGKTNPVFLGVIFLLLPPKVGSGEFVGRGRKEPLCEGRCVLQTKVENVNLVGILGKVGKGGNVNLVGILGNVGIL